MRYSDRAGSGAVCRPCTMDAMRDLVYQFAAPKSGDATISVIGLTNPVIYLGKGSCDATKAINCKGAATLTQAVQQGFPYYVFADGKTAGDIGAFTLTVEVQ